jgi:hypothetical protein
MEVDFSIDDIIQNIFPEYMSSENGEEIILMKKKMLLQSFEDNLFPMCWSVIQEIVEMSFERLFFFFSQVTNLSIDNSEINIKYLVYKMKQIFKIEHIDYTFEKIIDTILDIYHEFLLYHYHVHEYIVDDKSSDITKHIVFQYLLNGEVKENLYYILIKIFKYHEKELIFILHLKYNIEYTVNSVSHLF